MDANEIPQRIRFNEHLFAVAVRKPNDDERDINTRFFDNYTEAEDYARVQKESDYRFQVALFECKAVAVSKGGYVKMVLPQDVIQ